MLGLAFLISKSKKKIIIFSNINDEYIQVVYIETFPFFFNFDSHFISIDISVGRAFPSAREKKNNNQVFFIHPIFFCLGNSHFENVNTSEYFL